MKDQSNTHTLYTIQFSSKQFTWMHTEKNQEQVKYFTSKEEVDKTVKEVFACPYFQNPAQFAMVFEWKKTVSHMRLNAQSLEKAPPSPEETIVTYKVESFDWGSAHWSVKKESFQSLEEAQEYVKEHQFKYLSPEKYRIVKKEVTSKQKVVE